MWTADGLNFETNSSWYLQVMLSSALLPCSSSDESEAESDVLEDEDGSGAASVAAQTAFEVGLHGGALVDDEKGLLPPGADEAAYVRVSLALG
jgi:hypothetical protein